MTKFIKQNRKKALMKNYGLILVLLLSFWAIKPLFVPGFFPMHDDTQVARVFEMGKALKDGMFPVRWVQDLGYGYGYPIFNFYAPLAYYFGGFFTPLGFDALIATKIMMGIGIILAGIFMYLLSREFWGEFGAIVSGLFYVYAPYHAVDIYARGDIAEFWAYAFIPLMFWGFYKVFKGGKWQWVVISSLGYSGVILSHNLTAMMVTPFLLIVTLFYCYIAYRRKKLLTVYYLQLTVLLGLMLSAFYWVPALLEIKYTNVLSQIGGGADFRDHFVCIQQLWDSPWGFGGSAPGCIDGISFKIGKLHVLSVFIALFLAITTGKFFYIFRHSGKEVPDGTSASRIPTDLRDSGQDGYQSVTRQARMTGFILFSILGFAISTFLTLEISRYIWEAVPLMAFFQYPWRFLLLASFFSSLLSGFVVWFFSASTSTSNLRGVAKRPLGSESLSSLKYAGFAVVIFLLVNFNSKLFQPQTILPKTASDYTNEYALKWTASKTSDEYMPKSFTKPKSQDEIVKDRLIVDKKFAKIKNIVSNSHSISAVLDTSQQTNIQIAIAPFPAWKIYLDVEQMGYKTTPKGYNVSVPFGHHVLDVKFEQTPVEKIANTISLTGIVIVAVGIIIKDRKRLRV